MLFYSKPNFNYSSLYRTILIALYIILTVWFQSFILKFQMCLNDLKTKLKKMGSTTEQLGHAKTLRFHLKVS